MIDATTDPEIAQHSIDFIARLIPRYLGVLLGLQPSSSLETVLLFTLMCLTGPEPLPKRSAALFWASLVAVTDQPEMIHSALNEIMEHLGPLLAEALMIGLGGEAPRSDIRVLTDPLRKMAFKQPGAK
jgi:hypothetical protein